MVLVPQFVAVFTYMVASILLPLKEDDVSIHSFVDSNQSAEKLFSISSLLIEFTISRVRGW